MRSAQEERLEQAQVRSKQSARLLRACLVSSGKEMLEHYSRDTYLFVRLLKILFDGGYSGENFAQIVKSLTGAVAEVVKRNEAHKFAVLPKRWIVERTFGWLDKYRRFWKNCERKLHNTSQLVNLAFLRLMLKRC